MNENVWMYIQMAQYRGSKSYLTSSEGSKGSNTRGPCRKILSKNEWEEQRSTCVCVFLVCQSSKSMQLLSLYWERQSYLGQEHIILIWETATFSIGCVIEFHKAAVNSTFLSFSLLACVDPSMCECERERDTYSFRHLMVWGKVSETYCWKFRSHCWSLIYEPRIANLPKTNSLSIYLEKRWVEHEEDKAEREYITNEYLLHFHARWPIRTIFSLYRMSCNIWLV